MDDDNELLALLCTRIGAIMEDASAVAITAAAMEGGERTRAIMQIADAALRTTALADAAVALASLESSVASGHQ
jgi:uncharacterized protein (DUF1786 family)